MYLIMYKDICMRLFGIIEIKIKPLKKKFFKEI